MPYSWSAAKTPLEKKVLVHSIESGEKMKHPNLHQCNEFFGWLVFFLPKFFKVFFNRCMLQWYNIEQFFAAPIHVPDPFLLFNNLCGVFVFCPDCPRFWFACITGPHNFADISAFCLVRSYVNWLKGRVHCFSMQFVMNKCCLLNPEKIGVDQSCCFRENAKTHL